MASAKNRRQTKTSKGQRRSIAASVSAPTIDVALTKIDAWKAGKNPWITIANVDSNTNRSRPFIRVRANALYGNPKKIRVLMAGGSFDD